MQKAETRNGKAENARLKNEERRWRTYGAPGPFGYVSQSSRTGLVSDAPTALGGWARLEWGVTLQKAKLEIETRKLKREEGRLK
jgi:hypothetical protein